MSSFVCFSICENYCTLSTCKRSFRELEDDGLILRVRWEIGAPNRIYGLVPKKRD